MLLSRHGEANFIELCNIDKTHSDEKSEHLAYLMLEELDEALVYSGVCGMDG
jgi:hypothetical protein